jgi:GLPGLI family protein
MRSQYFDLRRDIEKTDTLDSAKLRIDYSLLYVRDTLNPDKISKDRKVLLIGDKLTDFYSYYIRQSDSAYTASDPRPLKRPVDVQGEGYEIFNNYPEGKRTVFDAITDLKIYKYKEDIKNPQWTISGEIAMVLGYPCIKATGRTGDRDYVVWFTPSIPVSSGPWKLGGLPGLILRAYDTKRHYVFECIGIEQLKQKQPIIVPAMWNKATGASKEFYMKDQKRYHNDPVNFLLSIGYSIVLEDENQKRVEIVETPNKTYANRGITLLTGIYIKDRYKKVPYNPIELE